MKRAAIAGIGVVVVVAVAAGAWELAAPRLGQAVLDRSVADFRASLGPGGSFTYSAAQTHPADRSASFDNVTLKLADGTTITAGHIDLAPGGAHRIKHIHAVQTNISALPGAPGTSVEIADLSGDNLDSAADAKPVPAPATRDRVLALLKPDLRDKMVQAAQHAQHFSADDITLKGLRITGTDAAQQPVTATVATLHIHDFGPGRGTDEEIGTLVATNLPITLPPALGRTPAPDANSPAPATPPAQGQTRHLDLSIGDVTAHGLRAADMLAYLAAGRSDGGRYLGQPSDCTLTDTTILVHGDADQPARVHFGTFKVAEHATSPLTDGNVNVDDLEIPAGKLAATIPEAVSNGALHGRVIARSTGNITTGESSVHPLQISFDHLLTLRLTLGGTLDPASVAPGANPAEALSRATLSALSIGIADEGLRQALLTRAAAGGSTDAIAATMAGRAQIVLAALGPAGASIAPAVASFIQKGGALQIDAHLAHPLPMQQFAHPGTPDAVVGLLTSLAPTATQSATLPPLAN